MPLTQPSSSVVRVDLAADMTAITASTTLVDVTGLGVLLAGAATERWLVKWWMLVTGNVTMDVKFGLSRAVGQTAYWGPINGGVGTSNGGWGILATGSTPAAVPIVTNAIAMGLSAGVTAIPLVAIVFANSTAGTVQLQVAQSTSDAGNLVVMKGSCMEAVRMAA